LYNHLFLMKNGIASLFEKLDRLYEKPEYDRQYHVYLLIELVHNLIVVTNIHKTSDSLS